LKKLHALLPSSLALLLLACAETPQPVAPPPPPPPVATQPTATQPIVPPPAVETLLALPAQLVGKAVVVAKGDPDEPRADLSSAIKPSGEGGLTRGLVVRLTADVPVWRMWSGPAKKDERGNTNRLGQWWSYDAPHGSQQGYRVSYEICASWNDLTYVARCTLKKGAVVAVGPGNSVSAKTCADQTGKEAYPANDRDWQVWISKVWTRSQEIDCPADTADYQPDLADISHPKK
jgi:hypothetical protein